MIEHILSKYGYIVIELEINAFEHAMVLFRENGMTMCLDSYIDQRKPEIRSFDLQIMKEFLHSPTRELCNKMCACKDVYEKNSSNQ